MDFLQNKEAYAQKLIPVSWVRNGLNYFDDRGLGLCVDPAGNVYVTGTCWGGLEWGSLNVYNSTSYTDQIFVIKLDTDGNEIWMKNAGIDETGFPYNDDHGQELISDDQGNIYLTGFISNNDNSPRDAKFDSIIISVAGNDSLAFLAKLSNDGDWQWVETFGGIVDHRDNAMGIDDEANLYVTGGYTDTKTFGTSTVTSNGLTDIFVVKYDSSGNFQWVQTAGSSLKDRGNAIAYCNDGNIYVTGEFRDSCDFGSNNLNNYGGPNGRDIFVAQISKNGDWGWASKAGSKKGSDREMELPQMMKEIFLLPDNIVVMLLLEYLISIHKATVYRHLLLLLTPMVLGGGSWRVVDMILTVVQEYALMNVMFM